MLCLVFACLFTGVFAEYNLSGKCSDVKVVENFDHTKFSGVWYNVASYASDSRDIYFCASMDFQEDNMGYTLRETYVAPDQGNATLKSYFARVDPTFDAGNKGRFVVSYEDGDKVLQFPFYILSTDYTDYAIAYTCRQAKKRSPSHYVFTWVLTRSKSGLEGVTRQKYDNALVNYSELTKQKDSFVHRSFSDKDCAYSKIIPTNVFTNYFW